MGQSPFGHFIDFCTIRASCLARRLWIRDCQASILRTSRNKCAAENVSYDASQGSLGRARNDYWDYPEVARGLFSDVGLKAVHISNNLTRVIDQTDQCAALRMVSVPDRVDDELIYNVVLFQACPSHF